VVSGLPGGPRLAIVRLIEGIAGAIYYGLCGEPRGHGMNLLRVGNSDGGRSGSAWSGAVSCVLRSCLGLFAVVFLLASAHGARAADSVGMVTKVANEAEIVSGGSTTVAAVGTVLHMGDGLHTGADARLQVTFRDNTILTLGENANVVIDKFVFDPDAGVGEAVLDATQGAFRFATGRIGSLHDKKITVSTPVAQLGVRGTEFWFGPIDGHFGTLVQIPTVVVSNQAGSVTLSAKGLGTDLISATQSPGDPVIWGPDKVIRALESTKFQPGTQQEQQHERRGENRGQNQGQTQTQAQTPVNPAPTLASPYSLAAALAATATFGVIGATTISTDEINAASSPASP
jgi:hypothetical protein